MIGLVQVYGLQWDRIAPQLNKDSMECQDFYTFLMNCVSRLYKDRKEEFSDSDDDTPMARTNEIVHNKPKKDRKKKRQRRKASQIERMYKCLEKHCNRSYGTEGALKMHIKIKHPHIHYDTKYSKGKLIKKQEDRKVKQEDIDLVESSLLLSNLSHSLETHQPRLVTPSPINYSSFLSLKQNEMQTPQFTSLIPEKMETIQEIRTNPMSLNSIINVQ